MRDFPNFYGCDGYPPGLSREYLRQAQRAFARHLSDIDGHTAPVSFPPFPSCEDTYSPRRPQGHRTLGEAQFRTFFEHRFGRVTPSAQTLRHRPFSDRLPRSTQPYGRPGVQDNINREPQWRTRHLPIRPTRRHYDPAGVSQDHSYGQSPAGGQKFAAERTIPLGRESFGEVWPGNSIHAHSNPPAETWAYMRPHNVLTPQGGASSTLFERVRRYSSTEPTAKPFRHRSPTQGHCSTINGDESQARPEAWVEPSANDKDCQDPENTDSWENIGTSSTHSSLPEPWTPFSTSYSEQPQQQEDYFTFCPRPRPRPSPHTPSFHDRFWNTPPSQGPRYRRRLPRESLQRLKSQLRHLQRADRQLKHERRHLSNEQALLNQQRAALQVEKSDLIAKWQHLQQARPRCPPPRHFWARSPHPTRSPSSSYSSFESVNARSSRTPPGTPSTPSPPHDFPSAAQTPPRPPAAALETYNRAWTARLAAPTRTPLPWPAASLQPSALTQPPSPLPRHLRPSRPDEAIATADVVAYNTVGFFARAFGLRPRCVLVEDEESGQRSWVLGVAGLQGVSVEVVGRMRAQVKMEVLRWHEDKRGGREGVEVEEGWARAVYAGVFAVKRALDEEVKRRAGGRGER